MYLILRQRIRDLELPPGSPLRKEDIAAEFGVSRAPVSEAIARLAEEGLVDVFPQHGSFVADIRAADVREGLFIRTGLEVEACRRAAALRSQDLCKALADNVAAQEEALNADDLQRFYELDEGLHELIFSALGHTRVTRFLDSARAPLDRMRRIVLPKGERPQATLREHRWVVEAIRAGDPELAAAAMRAHLNTVSDTVEEQLRSAPAESIR
ncbi:MAG: GntR family transcriptional regulator [Alphaproteobacteria bacterium]|nr:GntR family transcriptional regulator [Alphaproteobacteria bacterium]MBU1515187.1 GntR family transcriptional regulator [Alphaproteobacteria bacterium]MBU2092317.1 GntR family transcriptional regulator [Alphaproteobacteria bacterium]MBU2152911.1 GntR family transcriptional regulator [Alphaproteobacteria bacterium]MBU2305742.1 GntR family transcriptional regulator [Alphaproteobacteria bacterium]